MTNNVNSEIKSIVRTTHNNKGVSLFSIILWYIKNSNLATLTRFHYSLNYTSNVFRYVLYIYNFLCINLSF